MQHRNMSFGRSIGYTYKSSRASVTGDINDYTLTSTASMLADELDLIFKVDCYSAQMSVSRAIGALSAEDAIAILKCETPTEFSQWWNYFHSPASGCSEVRKVFTFCKGALDCSLFTREDGRGAVIIYVAGGMQGYHLMQVALPLALQKMNVGRDKEIVTPFVERLTKALADTNPQIYTDILRNFIEAHEYSEERIRDMLDGFEKSALDSKIRALETKINMLNNKIAELNYKLSEAIGDLSNAETELFGFQYVASQSDNNDMSLADYICTNKNISLIKRENNRIHFKAHGFLEYYDESLALIVINAPAVYAEINEADRKPVKELLEWIFNEKSGKIKSFAGFSIHATDGVATEAQDSSRLEMQNPHIYHYGCIGTFRQTFNELMQKKDLMHTVTHCANIKCAIGRASSNRCE